MSVATTPAATPTGGPTGKTFSARTSSANAATQTRFMTPKSEQQHHQQRTAAETIGPVREPEARCTCPSPAAKIASETTSGNGSSRRQYPLERRRLIEASRDQGRAPQTRWLPNAGINFGDRARPHKQPLS